MKKYLTFLPPPLLGSQGGLGVLHESFSPRWDVHYRSVSMSAALYLLTLVRASGSPGFQCPSVRGLSLYILLAALLIIADLLLGVLILPPLLITLIQHKMNTCWCTSCPHVQANGRPSAPTHEPWRERPIGGCSHPRLFLCGRWET